jgi:hypothetical protein
MTLKPKDLRELRRYLRAASDNVEDTADLIDDRDQAGRLRTIARELQNEMAEIDKKISAAERNGGAN